MSLVLMVGLLAVGGVVTSFAEYHFEYNLFDYILKGYRMIFGQKKA